MRLCQFTYGKADAATNMAIDALLLTEGARSGQAQWRLYGWIRPAVTFGYGQSWDFIRQSLGDFDGEIVRRATGGGIVDHRYDVTYALSIPAQHPLFRAQALDVYRDLHQCVADALCDLGHMAALAPCQGCRSDGQRPFSGGVCFQAPEPFDVILEGTARKLAGAAMKRSRDGILLQGSLDRAGLPGLKAEAFAERLECRLAAWLECEPSAPVGLPDERALAEAAARFRSEGWNRRR